MKTLLLFIALLCTVSLGSCTASATNIADAAKKQRARVTFSQPVDVMEATLKGQYLFVHDDLAMARGEACTYIYEGDAEIAAKLVVAFHCMPVARNKAAKFTVRTLMTWSGRYELREFQFGGSSEAHLVPVVPHAGHVNIAAME